MPIFLQHPVQTISEKDFHKLDYEIILSIIILSNP